MSIFLDACRFVAALVVVFGHLTQPAFTRVGTDETVYATGAVAVFFVLSGFVISYVVSRRENTLFEYATARVARIYSVLLPAVVLSAGVLYVGMKLDPAYMLQHFVTAKDFHPFLVPHRARQLLEHSTFPLTLLNVLREPWREKMYPPLDSAMWSLTYETGYYMLFGAAVFSRGVWRVLLPAALLVVMGPEVDRLLPVWVAGVVLQRFLARGALPPGAAYALGAVCLGGFVAMCWLWPEMTVWVDQPHNEWVHWLLHGRGMRTVFSWVFYYWGAGTALLIVGVAQFEGTVGRLLTRLERPIRWCAGHSFSIYLFHLPLFVLLYVTLHFNQASGRNAVLLFVTDVALCMALSSVSESRKLWWRRRVRGLLLHLMPSARSEAAG